MGTILSLFNVPQLQLPTSSLPHISSLRSWLPEHMTEMLHYGNGGSGNNSSDVNGCKKIDIRYRNSGMIKNTQGMYTSEQLFVDDKLINDELNSCEDPLFPLEELIGFVDHNNFDTIFNNFCNRYVGQSSNIYNLERERYYFVVIQDVDYGGELLLKLGISYWLVETLKRIHISKYPIWCKIANKYAGLDLKDLIRATETRYYYEINKLDINYHILNTQ